MRVRGRAKRKDVLVCWFVLVYGWDKDRAVVVFSEAGTPFVVETGSPNKNPRKIVFIKMIKARLCMLCDKHGVSD